MRGSVVKEKRRKPPFPPKKRNTGSNRKEQALSREGRRRPIRSPEKQGSPINLVVVRGKKTKIGTPQKERGGDEKGCPSLGGGKKKEKKKKGKETGLSHKRKEGEGVPFQQKRGKIGKRSFTHVGEEREERGILFP